MKQKNEETFMKNWILQFLFVYGGMSLVSDILKVFSLWPTAPGIQTLLIFLFISLVFSFIYKKYFTM